MLETQLAGNEFIAGDYSIADIANYCWIKPLYENFLRAKTPGRVAELTRVPRWIGAMSARSAVAISMTRFEGTALRVGRDVEAPLR